MALLIATAAISTWSFLSLSAQAAVVAQERDNAKQERDKAEEQRNEANKQRALAADNAEKARLQNAEADRQRMLASEAQLQAEMNQKRAEQLAVQALKNIQFIITDVDEKLAAQPGMSNLRVDLLQVLEKRWNELDLSLAGGIEGQAIPTLMAVRAKLAEAWVSLDKLKEADAQYSELYKKAQERVLVKNRSDASRSNLALVCTRWAPIRQRLTGELSEAEKLQAEANDLIREILRDPRPESGSHKLMCLSILCNGP